MGWDLESAKKDYSMNEPCCQTCKFKTIMQIEDYFDNKVNVHYCLVKEKLCTALDIESSQCKYYTSEKG